MFVYNVDQDLPRSSKEIAVVAHSALRGLLVCMGPWDIRGRCPADVEGPSGAAQ